MEFGKIVWINTKLFVILYVSRYPSHVRNGVSHCDKRKCGNLKRTDCQGLSPPNFNV